MRSIVPRFFVAVALMSSSIMVEAKKTSFKITATVTYGDAVTKIVVDGTTAEPTIQLTPVTGKPLNRKLTEENLKYILAEFEKLKAPDHVPKECYRSRMNVSLIGPNGKVTDKASCFAVKTITSNDYQKFANLLAMAAR